MSFIFTVQKCCCCTILNFVCSAIMTLCSSMSWCVLSTHLWYNMWCNFGSCIFEPSRSKISCVLFLFDKMKAFQLYFKKIEVLKIYATLVCRYLAYANVLRMVQLKKDTLAQEVCLCKPIVSWVLVQSQFTVFQQTMIINGKVI